MSRPASPNSDRRRNLFLLRGMVLVAVGALLFDAGPRQAGPVAIALLSVFALSNIGLLLAPRRLVGMFQFDLVVGLIDIVLVSLGIYLAGESAGALPVSCFLMVLVTDGFFEWENEVGEEFGIERIRDVLRRNKDRSAREIIRAMYVAVRRFVGEVPQNDDLTALVVRKL